MIKSVSLRDTEVRLVYCNLLYNSYKQNSEVFYTFVPNKSFGQLLEFSPKRIIFSRSFKSFHILKHGLLTKSAVKVLEIEDEINITLVID